MYPGARRFLDVHAETAADLGWTALDLFGVHPVVGTIRVDCAGALMMGTGADATELRPDLIRFGRLAFYRHPQPGRRIPAWEFGRVASHPEP